MSDEEHVCRIFDDEGKCVKCGILHSQTPEDAEDRAPFLVDFKLGAVESGWNSVDKDIVEQLKNGDWRIMSFAFDKKRGVGCFFVKHDAAELGDDHFAALSSLASIGEMLFKAMSNQAIRVGHL